MCGEERTGKRRKEEETSGLIMGSELGAGPSGTRVARKVRRMDGQKGVGSGSPPPYPTTSTPTSTLGSSAGGSSGTKPKYTKVQQITTKYRFIKYIYLYIYI